MCRSFPWFVLVLLLAGGRGTAGNVSSEKSTELRAPSVPPVLGLEVEPARVKLEDGWDERKVIVWGKTAEGEKVDLTGIAVFKADSAAVTVEGGFIVPREKGEGVVLISAAGHEFKLPVEVAGADRGGIRFVRDVMPVMSKAGCNAGTCHGSAKGKNGFKLSLRGYDPEFDYQALINDLSGRRFNRVKVEESLMLLKPTADVPHEGRQAIKPGSREYALLRQWIGEGTKFEDPAAGRAVGLEVLPSEIYLRLPGMSQQVVVLARYRDGSTRDVTRNAILASNNEEIARVKDGVVVGQRRGEAAVLVRYEGNYASKEITIMGDRTGFVWQDSTSYNYVDEKVDAKLRKMKIQLSALCSDAEFIRRVSLDLTGQPPKPGRVRAFLADSAPSREKREKLVEELLGSEDYVEFWANKWADLLQCNSEALGQKGVWLYREWIRQAIAQNKPYDGFVRELLLARGSSFQNPAVNYYRVLREPGKITEDVSQTFLGTRFTCNKCHDHPFEKWTQNQYYEFGAYFSQIGIKRGTLGKETIRSFTGDNITVTGEEVVYRRQEGGPVTHPKTGMAVAPRVPFGETQASADTEDFREPFVAWLTSKENPLFAKAMANRVWSYFFGRGIIDPVDDIRAGNPPSNAELLEALTRDFIASGFDTKRLMRTICRSRTYQLSIVPNRWNEDDKINFSHALPRRLSAEQLVDAIAVATGHRPKFGDLPATFRAVELRDGMVDDFLSLFGRPKRQSACECERTSNLTLSHAMSLINGSTIGEAVAAPESRFQAIVDSEKDDRKVVEEIYLSCLSRLPTARELEAVHFSGSGSRLEMAQDLAWALMNSPAFLFNR